MESGLSAIYQAIVNFTGTLFGGNGVLKEQTAVPFTLDAIAGGETNVLNLAVANTRYVIRNLRLKSADPGANDVEVRLYELINGAPVNTVTFDVNTLNFVTYFSLMDMFGVAELAGDNIRITVQSSAGGPYAILGEYSFAKTG